ncbi:MAG: DUF6273 domain-containing protein [Clostridiales bacterium]|nr:DUF6273 domain-containing protein [Clostridiales bacterium]
MKRFIGWMLAGIMLFGCLAGAGAPALAAGEDVRYRPGDVVTFGMYDQTGFREPAPIEWIVLDERDGKLFLISRLGLAALPYDDGGSGTDWESSSLRAWLNDRFLRGAFDEEERARIIETRLMNLENSAYPTGGRGVTSDRVFVPSEAEFTYYAQMPGIGRGVWQTIPSPAAMMQAAEGSTDGPKLYDSSVSRTEESVECDFLFSQDGVWIDMEMKVIYPLGLDAIRAEVYENGKLTSTVEEAFVPFRLRTAGGTPDRTATVQADGTLDLYGESAAPADAAIVRPALWVDRDAVRSVSDPLTAKHPEARIALGGDGFIHGYRVDLGSMRYSTALWTWSEEKKDFACGGGWRGAFVELKHPAEDCVGADIGFYLAGDGSVSTVGFAPYARCGGAWEPGLPERVHFAKTSVDSDRVYDPVRFGFTGARTLEAFLMEYAEVPPEGHPGDTMNYAVNALYFRTPEAAEAYARTLGLTD